MKSHNWKGDKKSWNLGLGTAYPAAAAPEILPILSTDTEVTI